MSLARFVRIRVQKMVWFVIFMAACLACVGCQVCDSGLNSGFCTGGTAADRERDEAASAAQLLEKYAKWHSQVLGNYLAASRRGMSLARPPVLVCQPQRGLGSRIQMVMTCLVTSIASERLLAVDWDASYLGGGGKDAAGAGGDNVGTGKLDELFERPGFDWSSGWLERVVSREEVVRESGATSSLGSGEEERKEARLLADMLCGDLRAHGGSKAVLVLKGHAWWDVALQNPRYRDMFASSLGVDERGVVKVFERLGPMMLTPVARVREAVEAIGALALPGAYMVGLIGPYHGSDSSRDKAGSRGGDDEKADEGVGKAMSKVTYAVIPEEQRSRPITYFLVSTSATFKRIVRYMLTHKGGEGSEVSRHRMSETGELDAMRVKDASHRVALADLGVTVHVLSSGSRLVYISREIGSQQGCPSSDECLAMDLRQELVEMWLLTSVHLTLRDSSSSIFAAVASSWAPKPSFYVDRGTLTAHKQSTCEPHAGGGRRAWALEALGKQAPCFDAKALGVAWLLTSA